MYILIKTWDNRREVKAKRLRQKCINGRTWTRRVQWLEETGSDTIKLKFWDGEVYKETGIPAGFAPLVWQRFQEGQSIKDAISIFSQHVTPSRKAAQQESINRVRKDMDEGAVPNDPVHCDPETGKWYFYDETWTDRLGPYDTKEQAREACVEYGRQL